MDWATRKKMKYFIFLFVLLIGGIFAIAFPVINRPPSCTDGKKNGTETGVDCGGECMYLCNSEVMPIHTVWVRAIPSGVNKVNVISFIRNDNKTAGLAETAYRITLYDDKGGIILKKDGTASVPPNASTPIFLGPVDIGQRKVQTTTFEWTDELKYMTYAPKNLTSALETIDTKLETGSSTRLTANLHNTNRNLLSKVSVVALLYDKDDNAVLASKTIIDSIEAEGNATAVFYWNQELKDSITKIEVLPIFEKQ